MKPLITIIILFVSLSAITQEKFDAVIVGENVRMRSEPNTKAGIITTLNTGDVIKIIDASETRVIIPLNQSSCDDFGYYWYKVNTTNNKSGWIFGAFVYLLNQEEDFEPELKNQVFTLSNKQFYFNTAAVESYGAADENGLTGCDENSIPFFYDKNQNKIFPIKLDMNNPDNTNARLVCTKVQNWLLLYNGEGGNDYVDEIKSTGNALELTINRSFQEGGATVVLLLTFNDNYFIATVKSNEFSPGY